VEDDLERVSIGSDDDELGDASIKCLGGLVGALLDLLQRGTLRHEVEEFGGEVFSSKGLGTLGNFLSQVIITIIVEKGL
jgi:hypothetical protein